MLGQALPGIMPTHTFWRTNMHREWELITQAHLSLLSLPCLSRRLTPRLSARLHVRYQGSD